jgi:hypothetical protein
VLEEECLTVANETFHMNNLGEKSGAERIVAALSTQMGGKVMQSKSRFVAVGAPSAARLQET